MAESCTINHLIDTHCHLDDPSIAGRLESVIVEAAGAGVSKFVIPGAAPENWIRIERIAESNANVYPAYGIHPLFAGSWSTEFRENLINRLPQSIAVGEIGLDYEYSELSREVQEKAFRGQLQLAVASGLPVLIHCRGAFRDLVAILEEEHVSEVGGIMHAFSGSPEVAEACIRLGLLISVAGPVTWVNAKRPVRVVEKLSLAHLVLETDSPDMTPEPYRGRCNEPSFLPCIAEAVARIKGISYSEVAEITSANAARVFRW